MWKRKYEARTMMCIEGSKGGMEVRMRDKTGLDWTGRWMEWEDGMPERRVQHGGWQNRAVDQWSRFAGTMEY